MRTRNRPHTVESLPAVTQPDGECLVWQGATRGNGYGAVTFMGKQTTVHRAMYMLVNGAIPDGMEVDHKCSNRGCINPEHLHVVTHEENMRLGLERRTHCRAGHEWTEENTYLGMVQRKQGGTRLQRYCRECRKLYQRQLRTS